MSIACPMFESEVSSLDAVRTARTGVKPPSTARRIEANRRNARRSTGPRTAEGKARVSRNALKHGLCSNYACLPSEREITFDIFVGELEQEMRPRTVLQRNPRAGATRAALSRGTCAAVLRGRRRSRQMCRG